MPKAKQHGGQREGAGPPRKMVEPERVTITIERKAKEEMLKRYGDKWQEVLRSLIDSHLHAV